MCENYKEVAKKMTRKEFIRKLTAGGNCPSDYGLNNYCGLFCKECVKRAVEEIPKDIKFEGEEDNGKKKTLNLNTANVFELISNNNKLKYKRISDGLVLSYKDGFYHWDSGHNFLSPDDKWKLVEEKKDKEVTFMEAIDAFIKGEDIYCIINGEKYEYMSNNTDIFNDIWNLLKDKDGKAISAKEIRDGKWFIKA